MSETTEPVEVAPEAPDVDDEPYDRKRAEAKIAKVNREAAALRERLKELEPFAAKAKELEEAQKSEAERNTEKLTAAERRAIAAEEALLRRDVADEKGLTPAQAKRLVGKTREELLADADDFIAALPVASAAATQRTPVEALRPGALPNVPAPTLDEQYAELMKDPHKNRKALMQIQGQKLQEIATGSK